MRQWQATAVPRSLLLLLLPFAAAVSIGSSTIGHWASTGLEEVGALRLRGGAFAPSARPAAGITSRLSRTRSPTAAAGPSLLPVVLCDNGSRRAASHLALRETARRLSALLGGREVRPCSLGFSDAIDAAALGGTPARTLRAELESLAAGGAAGVVVVPLFLGPSEGLRRGVAECAAVAPPGFEVRLAPCLVADEHPHDTRVARAMAALVLRTVRRAGLAAPPRVLLTDHGTPSRAVHAVRSRLVREVRSLLGGRAAAVVGASMERREGAAYDFNEPLLERALQQPDELAAEVVVAMAFLLPGRHAGEGGDVDAIIERARAAAAGRVHVTPLLGAQSLVLSVLADRVREADGSLSRPRVPK